MTGLSVVDPGLRQRRTHSPGCSPTEGAVVVALSDSTRRLCQPVRDRRGARRSRTRQSTARSTGLPGTEAITNDELIEFDCDVLAPCALEQVVNEENAANVKARIIAEGANGPVTPAADQVLDDNGVLVLPDVLVNAGGVVVSYFEWVQGLQEYFWKEEEVNAKPERHRHPRVPGDLGDDGRSQDEHAHSLPTGMLSGASRRRRSRGAFIPRVVVYHADGLPPLRTASSRWWTACVRATSNVSTSAAIPSWRLLTARRSPSWRSTASAPSRFSSSPRRSGGG